MQEINTIFWDLDGTLINTDELYDQAIKFACETLNCKMVHKIESIPSGLTLLEDFSFVTGLSLENDFDLLNKLKDQAVIYFKAHFNDNLIIKSSLELFNYFHQLGLAQSIISNSNQVLCDFITTEIGIKDKCRFCFGAETVKNGKPNPDLYIHALNAHMAKESQCLALEDSATGIKAAKAANLTVIGVGSKSDKATPHYIWNIDLEPASIIINKMSKLYRFTEVIPS